MHPEIFQLIELKMIVAIIYLDKPHHYRVNRAR